MKKFFIAATALFLITGSLQAQSTKEETKAGHHKNMHGKKPLANINLSDDQKAKTNAINEAYSKQFADLRKNTGMSVGDYRTKTEALRKEQHEKMQAVLTPEQKTQIAAQRKNSEQKMKEGQAKRFDQMKTKLGLTEEQTKKLKENQAGLHEKIKGIRENKSLTDEQKKEQVRAISKQQHEQLKSVLTPEQLQKMKAGRKGRGKGIQTEK